MSIGVIETPSITHLQLDELAVDFLELAFMIVEPLELGETIGRVLEEVDDGELDGRRGLFPFWMLC